MDEDIPPHKVRDATLVPAFESAIGQAPVTGKGSVRVRKDALDRVNGEIAEERKDEMRFHNEVAQVASLFATRAIRPDEIAALRRRMFETVSKGLTEVDAVIQGQKKWTPTQVRLFAILTERVMPKLSNIVVEDATTKKIEDLTLEELEALALGKSKANAVDAVVRQAAVLDEAAEKVERREAKQEVTRQLAYIDALDTAEKKYIARKIGSKIEEAKPGDKPQPPPTTEQIAKVRKAHVSHREHWKNQGMTDEQIEQRMKEAVAKRLATAAAIRAEKLERLAVNAGLGEDEREMARTLEKTRRQTLKEFRVNPLKGVRSQTALTREATLREKRRARQEEREENPRVYVRGVAGVPEDKLDTIRLREFRELRPDLFVPDPKTGLGLPEGDDGAGQGDEK